MVITGFFARNHHMREIHKPSTLFLLPCIRDRSISIHGSSTGLGPDSPNQSEAACR